jgi:hypothetical protein
MNKLTRARGSACVAIALLFGFAASASAETSLIACTHDGANDPPFKILIDFTKSTVQWTSGYGATNGSSPAEITDGMITFRSPAQGDTWQEYRIDRETGAEMDHPCGGRSGCAHDWYHGHCQKATQQF